MHTNPHPLFRRFPLRGLKSTTGGMLPVPYHIYDGHALFMGGTANLDAVRRVLDTEDVHPVVNQEGKALMGVWVIDATNASLGAHLELQFSIIVSHQPIEPVSAHPLAILELLMFNPDVRLLCHGLWNSTETVVTYNREVLALNAMLTHGEITRDPKQQIKTFHFTDSNGELIFSGNVSELKRTPSKVVRSLMRLMGVRKFFQAANESCLESQVVNPMGILPFNADAQAYVMNNQQTLQFFNRQTDTLEFGHALYRSLQFQAQFMEHMSGFKFVYLNMHNAADSAYLQA